MMDFSFAQSMKIRIKVILFILIEFLQRHQLQ